MKIDLDFSLDGSAARLEYVESYLEGIDPTDLTHDNIEMISNYLLWGVQTEEDLDFEIESKNSPWTKGKEVSSLEAMIEQEQETGASAYAKMADAKLNVGKRKLERGKVVDKVKEGHLDVIAMVAGLMTGKGNTSKDCFAILGRLQEDGKIDFSLDLKDSADGSQFIQGWHALTETWFDLWSRIDELEFMIQSYEIAHGKRRADLPIRDELFFRIACSIVWKGKWNESLDLCCASLREKALKWEGYEYLKKKRQLVSLRTQQYALIDCIQGETLLKKGNSAMYWHEEEKGVAEFYPFMREEFMFDTITQECFTAEFMQKCVRALRELDAVDAKARAGRNTIDFRNEEVVRYLILSLPDLEEAVLRGTDSETIILRPLLKYLNYYIKKCNFPPDLLLVLRAKRARVSNKEIASLLKEKFGLDYKENYISTIFTKRIVDAIVEQVNLHYKMIEYITMGPNVFKRCSKCGRLLPRNSTYFNKRTSTSDGFFSSCKDCKNAAK